MCVYVRLCRLISYNYVRERLSIASDRLGGGVLRQNAETANAGEGGLGVYDKMLTLGGERIEILGVRASTKIIGYK